jgi:hypothetical protein
MFGSRLEWCQHGTPDCCESMSGRLKVFLLTVISCKNIIHHNVYVQVLTIRHNRKSHVEGGDLCPAGRNAAPAMLLLALLVSVAIASANVATAYSPASSQSNNGEKPLESMTLVGIPAHFRFNRLLKFALGGKSYLMYTRTRPGMLPIKAGFFSGRHLTISVQWSIRMAHDQFKFVLKTPLFRLSRVLWSSIPVLTTVIGGGTTV